MSQPEPPAPGLWHPVPRPLLGQGTPPARLYVRMPSGMRLYFAPQAMEWADALARLERKPIDVFWVADADFPAMQQHLADRVGVVAADEDISPRARGELTYHVCYQALAEALACPDDPIAFARAKVVGREAIDAIIDHPEILPGVGLLMGHHYDTFAHSVQVAALTVALAQRIGVGEGDRETVAAYGLGALFHDFGKARVPRVILDKPGPLSGPEWRLMHQHPAWGRALLEQLPTSGVALEPVLQHHERFDGQGYPAQLRGQDIHLSARITKLADVFHALTSRRAYRTPLNAYGALVLMRDQMGDHFDQELLAEFIQIVGTAERPPRSLPVGPAGVAA